MAREIKMTMQYAAGHDRGPMKKTGNGPADLPSVNAILIIQMKFIGDLVLATPLARNLRLAYPQAKLVFLCAGGCDGLVVGDGIATHAVTFRRSRQRGTFFQRALEVWRVVRALRRYEFDLVIDITCTKTSRLAVRVVNAPIRIGYDETERPLRWWERDPSNLTAKAGGSGDMHVLHRYLAPLKALEIPQIHLAPMLEPGEEALKRADRLLSDAGLHAGRFVAVHAGASFPGRCWEPEKFAAAIDCLAERTGLRSVLVGGPEEAPIAEAILARANAKPVNCVGKFSLGDLLALLSQARLFLGNESGPMHMAAAVGTPVVGLYGLTDPEIWGPVGVPSATLRPDMPCACVLPELCKPDDPRKAFCVRKLGVDEVVAAAARLLAETDHAELAGL